MNIIQKYCHENFGWHYALVRYVSGKYSVDRVHALPNGDYYLKSRGNMLVLNDIKSGTEITPLTWDHPVITFYKPMEKGIDLNVKPSDEE